MRLKKCVLSFLRKLVRDEISLLSDGRAFQARGRVVEKALPVTWSRIRETTMLPRALDRRWVHHHSAGRVLTDIVEQCRHHPGAIPAGIWPQHHAKQDAQLSQRDRAAGCVSLGQKWKTAWNWETIFYRHYRSIFNHCDIISLQSYRIRWKNAKYGLLRRSGSFKVIEVGTNWKPVCDLINID